MLRGHAVTVGQPSMEQGAFVVFDAFTEPP
jgi:hypothetical protein